MKVNNVNKQWLIDQCNPIIDNNYMKNHYLNLLYLICLNRFIWKGLPKSIDTDFLEKTLINEGVVAIVDTEDYGLIACHCIGDDLNIYGRPSRYYCYSEGGIIDDFYETSEIVVIRNNKLEEPSIDFINRYAQRLSEIKKTKEINIHNQKTPILIKTSQQQKLTLENIYRQFDENYPVIFGTDDLQLDNFQVLKTDSPYLADKLQICGQDELNECLQFLGINTVQVEKKERLTDDEVNSNNDMTNICLSIFLNSREQAIEDLERVFNIKAEIELAEYCKEKYNKENEVMKNE